MKISKALFDDPKAARNVAATMHEAPRESNCWFAWFLAGLMFGGLAMKLQTEYDRNYRGADVRMSPTHSVNPTAVPR